MSKIIKILIFPVLFILLAAKPIPISDARQLANIDPNLNYILVSDIDMSGWQPIDFYGELDGQNHSIKNLRSSLFRTLDKAAVRNLKIEDSIIYGQGALAAAAINSELEHIRFISGKINGSGYVGGLIGKGENTIIRNCLSDGTVSAFQTGKETVLGGLAGLLSDCTVVDSVSSGAPILFAGRGNIGGFVGRASNTVFKGCHSSRDVKNRGNAGGFAGFLEEKALLIACYASGDVYGGKAAGGFAGIVQGNHISENANHSIRMIQCHSTGNVEADTAGGFAGDISYAAVSASSAEGDVSGLNAGGFVGQLTNKSRISNSCALGDVFGENTSGGFVGIITLGSGIEYAFSAGNVKGKGDTGGFAGTIEDTGSPTTLFGCLSFAMWVSSCKDGTLNRLVGKMDHEGVNNCYAYLGSTVAAGERLLHISPNAYGPNGGDFNNTTIGNILNRLGWSSHYWSFDWENNESNNDLRKPRIILVDK